MQKYQHAPDYALRIGNSGSHQFHSGGLHLDNVVLEFIGTSIILEISRKKVQSGSDQNSMAAASKP
jgi:hypothetical protein